MAMRMVLVLVLVLVRVLLLRTARVVLCLRQRAALDGARSLRWRHLAWRCACHPLVQIKWHEEHKVGPQPKHMAVGAAARQASALVRHEHAPAAAQLVRLVKIAGSSKPLRLSVLRTPQWRRTRQRVHGSRHLLLGLTLGRHIIKVHTHRSQLREGVAQ